MTQVKGLVFRSWTGTFKRLRGADAYARTLERLPLEIADSLRVNAFVTGSWYPCAWLNTIQVAAREACGEGIELTRAIAREAVKDDFRSGVHRLVTLAASPEWILKWAPKIVGYYYDKGRLVVEEAAVGRAMGRFEGFHGFTVDLWEQVIGGSMGVMEEAGAKGLTSKALAGGGEGDAHMTFAMKWT
jgi:hypothetical protein